ncbi:hypothetical protein [Pseudomonas syringae group sp. J309-1]|uniref:hypothetical protein n=1 Tax=Pseudomonas syringae group sp. J309-1 TaxID=3079588 RepID=UPI00290C1DC7|nr:hypothetical protein [Pseudomonas syringae group sp. J309-1]MDU8357936.1 hypothetical protein [Pseudomonas syringae group sp. J309-1]
MSVHKLVEDLEKKLQFYNQNLPPDNPLRDASYHQILASLLFRADIYPLALTREVVRGLLESKLPWPTYDGGHESLSISVSLDELLKLRVITFSAGLLEMVRLVSPEEDMPDKLRSQLEALAFLDRIRRGDGLVQPHVRIVRSKEDVSHLLMLADHLEPMGDGISVSVTMDDIAGVGRALWKAMRGRPGDSQCVFFNWMVKMAISSGHSFVFDIFPRGCQEQEEFLDVILEFILADDSLRDSWQDCAIDVALASNRLDILVYDAGPPMSFTATPKGDVVPETKGNVVRAYCSELDIRQLNWILDDLARRAPVDELDMMDWWVDAQRGRYSDYGYLFHMVLAIVKNERLSHSSHSSFLRTQQLVSLIDQSPRMARYLLVEVNLTKYSCFLLSELGTSHLGFIKVYKEASRILLNLSDAVDYSHIWKGVLMDQALHIYSIVHSSGVSESAPEAICNIHDLVVWLVEKEFVRSPSRHTFSGSLVEKLKTVLEEMPYVDDNGGFLLGDRASSTAAIVMKRGRTRNYRLGETPLGEWVFLSWCLEGMAPPTFVRDKGARQRIQAAGNYLIHDYLKVLEEKTGENGSGGDEPLVFDELGWWLLSKTSSPGLFGRFLHVMETYEPVIAVEDSSDRRKLVGAARIHTRVLLQILTRDNEKGIRDQATDALLLLVERFGFDPQCLSGMFSVFNEQSEYTPVRLWLAVARAANDFDDEKFNHLLHILKEEPCALGCLLRLYSETVSEQRRTQVHGILTTWHIRDEELFWTPEIRAMSILAANNGLPQIAKYLADYGLENARTQHRQSFRILSDLFRLKEIFDTVDQVGQDKINALAKCRIEVDEQAETEKDALRVRKNEFEYFKRYLIAHVLIDVDPDKAVSDFTRLYKERRQLEYLIGKLKASLGNIKSAGGGRRSEFQRLYQDWYADYKALKFPELSVVDLTVVLGVLSEAEDSSAYQYYWNQLPDFQRASPEIAKVHRDYLQRCAGSLPVGQYFDFLKSIHGDAPGLLDESTMKTGRELLGSWLDIDELSTAVDDAVSRKLAFLPRSPNEWNTDEIAETVLSDVRQVCESLLKRKNNLRRRKHGGKQVMPLDEENMINDWLVEIWHSRVNRYEWSVTDQSRMGASGSRGGVGEVDAVLSGRHGTLSILEAFRLGRKNTGSVIEHLDKLAGYNTVGASVLCVVVYSVASRFDELCNWYEEKVVKHRYIGFSGKNKVPLERVAPEDKPHLKILKEVKMIDTRSSVHIYHFLLDLKNE